MSSNAHRLIVLAGGISSRMRLPSAIDAQLGEELKQQAEERPKGMIGVGSDGRPFLDYLLYNAREAGLTDVVLVIGERDKSVRAYYGTHDVNNSFHGLSVSYVLQPIPAGRHKPLGTADALMRGLHARPDWKGKDFIVCNSDNLYSVGAFRMLLECEDRNCLPDYDRSGLEFPEERIAQFGVTRKDSDGYLIEIIEKPPLEGLDDLRSADGTVRISMNIFRLEYDRILPFLEECPEHPVRKEKELVAAVTTMVQNYPRSLKALPLREHVPDLTYREDIIPVRNYLRENIPSLTW